MKPGHRSKYLNGVITSKPGRLLCIAAVCIVSVCLCTTVVFSQDTLKLKKYAGDLKTIDVSVNGSVYSFLFDTGGGETLIAPRLAAKLNKTVYGLTTGFRMNGDMIRYQKADSIDLWLSNTRFHHATAGVWDVMRVLPDNFPLLDGVLSLKSFAGRRITLDLANNWIILETAKSYRKKIAHMVRHPSRFANGHEGNETNIFLEARYSGRSYWFLMDSGNLGETLISESTATSWNLVANSDNGSLGKVTFTLGRETIPAESQQDRIIYDGAFNYYVLSNVTILIDFIKEEVWIGKRK